MWTNLLFFHMQKKTDLLYWDIIDPTWDGDSGRFLMLSGLHTDDYKPFKVVSHITRRLYPSNSRFLGPLKVVDPAFLKFTSVTDPLKQEVSVLRNRIHGPGLGSS